MSAILKKLSIFYTLSFAAFFATLFIFSPNVMVIHAFDRAEYTAYFASQNLAACCLTALVMTLTNVFGAGRKMQTLFDNTFFKLAVPVIYFFSNTVFVVCIISQAAISQYIVTPCAIIAGIACVFAIVQWSELFDELSLAQAIVPMIVALLLASLLGFFVDYFSSFVAMLVEVLLLVAGCLPLLLKACGIDLRRNSEADLSLSEDPAEPDLLKRPDIRAFTSVVFVPLVGLAISSFATGVKPETVFDLISVHVLAMAVATVILLPALLFRSKKPLFTLIYQVYIPVFASVAVALSIIFRDGYLSDIALTFTYSFYLMVSAISIAVACAIANAREFSRTFVFGTLLVLFSGISYLGILLGGKSDLLYENNTYVLLCLTTVYVCGMLISSGIGIWQTMRTSASFSEIDRFVIEGSPSVKEILRPETFEERIDRLVRDFELSPREAEVVGFIGRGHSSVFVAKTLLISESTVYTHVRNIYRKLNINSREELIQMINERIDVDASMDS